MNLIYISDAVKTNKGLDRNMQTKEGKIKNIVNKCKGIKDSSRITVIPKNTTQSNYLLIKTKKITKTSLK